MNISLFENDQIELVQKKKKYQQFTVTEIGGPAEILIWRQKQAEKEAANQVVRLQLVDKSKDRMFGADAPQGDGVTWKGNAGLRHGRGDGAETWADKLAYAKDRQKNYMKPELIDLPKQVYDFSKPKLSLFKRFTSWISGLWNHANF